MIDISDLEFGEKVGMGGTGIVYKGQWKSRQINVAIKATGEINKTQVGAVHCATYSIHESVVDNCFSYYRWTISFHWITQT